MKKKITALLLALILLLSNAGAASAAQTSGFTDVPEDEWYTDAVKWAVEKNITEGMGGGLFEPNGVCNRAQVVTFLWRLDGKPAASSPNIFTDVPSGEWYADAVLWAVERRVTDGMGAGLFQPGGTCNRAQIVTFLWKYAGKPASDAQNPFTDVPSGDWYADAVKWAVEKGITTGLTETTFGPEEPCNRAQIVTFLHRYAEVFTEPDWGMGEIEI